jgi:hypothetical protein
MPGSTTHASAPLLAFAFLLVVTTTAAAQDAAASAACAPPLDDDHAGAVARTDHRISGNRVVAGCGPLGEEVVDIDLRGIPSWVLPDPGDRGTSWFVVLDDGSIDRVSVRDPGNVVMRTESPPLPPGGPPLAVTDRDGRSIIGSALVASRWFADPLPDTRVTEVAGDVTVALVGPTDRYAHGVLGDDLEASAIEVRGDAGTLVRIEMPADQVIEGTSAMVVELDGDPARPELLVTVSDASAGARLALYDLEGGLVAESEPIGRGFRWLHQIGVGATGPGGETEIITVRTPHIGGIVEAYRLVDGQLELVASQAGYSSHALGSANLDMALLADADGGGRLDVVVPRQDRSEIAVLSRTDGGFGEIASLALGGTLVTNVAATPDADGRLVLAMGTADKRLRIFR